jgi:predicted TIM-barrel fold metal-dependent hydrolase
VSEPGKSINDNFMAMVTAKAQVTLPLGEFQPKSTLVTAEHHVERARFPVIDYHNHLDALDPIEVLRIMDACGIERMVNITMKTGDEAIAIMRKFHSTDAQRFATIGWMDWSGVERDDFVQVTLDRLERLVEHGARGIKFWKDLGLTVREKDGNLLRVDDERLAPVFDKAAELGIPVMFHIADPDAFFLPIDGNNERYEELAAHPDWGFYGAHFSKRELLDQRDRVIARHPKTTFVAAHVAECGENLGRARQLLQQHANVVLDISGSHIPRVLFFLNFLTAFSSAPTWCPRSRCIAFTSGFWRRRTSTLTIPRMRRVKGDGRSMGSIFRKKF